MRKRIPMTNLYYVPGRWCAQQARKDADTMGVSRKRIATIRDPLYWGLPDTYRGGRVLRVRTELVERYADRIIPNDDEDFA